MQAGDNVKVLPPFDAAFPGIYAIESVDENGVCTICEDRMFDPIYLELA